MNRHKVWRNEDRHMVHLTLHVESVFKYLNAYIQKEWLITIYIWCCKYHINANDFLIQCVSSEWFLVSNFTINAFKTGNSF